MPVKKVLSADGPVLFVPSNPEIETPVNPQTFLLTPPHPLYGRYHRAHNYFEDITANQDRNPSKALWEWVTVAKTIEALGGKVTVMPPHPNSEMGFTDMVFMANSGYLFQSANGKPLFVGARMLYPIRQGEAQALQLFWESLGVHFMQPEGIWEGQADVSRELPGGRVILTHGVRSTLDANRDISNHFNQKLITLNGHFGASPTLSLENAGADVKKVLHIQMKEPFFHGDTCVNVVKNKAGETFVIYCPDALTDNSIAALKQFAAPDCQLIAISKEDAVNAYVANSLEVNGTLLLLPAASGELRAALRDHGLNFVDIPGLGELFVKGGGGTRCCVLEIRDPQKFEPIVKKLGSEYPFDVDFWKGMIPVYPKRARLDSPGWAHDPRPLALKSATPEIPSHFESFPKQTLDTKPKWLEYSAKNIANLYITEGNEISVKVGANLWNDIVGSRPGAVIRLKSDVVAEVVSIDDIKPGDILLDKNSGGLMSYKIRSGENDGPQFGFMGTEITTERFTEALGIRVAQTMMKARERGQKIAFVGGPAIAHSDASKYLAKLINAGWIDFLSTGNALATHDLELNHPLYGTSLGSSPEMELKTLKRAVPKGEQHHLRTINEARKYETLAQFVKAAGISNRSAIKAALDSKIDLLMTGSIRDDGPLPEVVTNVTEANRQLTEKLKGASLVIGVGTYLHTSAALSRVGVEANKVIVDVDADTLERLKLVNPYNTLAIQDNAAHFLQNLCESLGIYTDDIKTPTPLGSVGRSRYQQQEQIQKSGNVIQTELVSQEGVAPAQFLTSSNQPTILKLENGTRIPVVRQKMDGALVLNRDDHTATVKPFRKLHVGDEVVVGESGVELEALSAKNTPKTLAALASRLMLASAEGKDVVLVTSDALISSGASSVVADLVREGLITSLHSGIALPLYEVEKAQFGTINNLDENGNLEPGNTARAMALIRIYGGFEGEAFEKLAPNGIFAVAKAKGAKILITASPNDTATLPGSITDMSAAQDAIRALHDNAGLVMDVASVLHSVAAGNQAPGHIPVVVVDKNKFSIGKLADRGTVQAHGMKMDAGQFFAMLQSEIEKLKSIKAEGAIVEDGLWLDSSMVTDQIGERGIHVPDIKNDDDTKALFDESRHGLMKIMQDRAGIIEDSIFSGNKKIKPKLFRDLNRTTPLSHLLGNGHVRPDSLAGIRRPALSGLSRFSSFDRSLGLRRAVKLGRG